MADGGDQPDTFTKCSEVEEAESDIKEISGAGYDLKFMILSLLTNVMYYRSPLIRWMFSHAR